MKTKEFNNIIKKAYKMGIDGKDCIIEIDGEERKGISELAIRVREIYKKGLREMEKKK